MSPLVVSLPMAPTTLTSFDAQRDMLTGSLKVPHLATCPLSNPSSLSW
jgi:hypothetical protein